MRSSPFTKKINSNLRLRNLESAKGKPYFAKIDFKESGKTETENSDVLPELGVKRVKQTTFVDFAVEAIGKPVKIQDGNEKLLLFLDNSNATTDSETKRFMKLAAEFKASPAIKELMESFISSIENSLLPEGDLGLERLTIYTRREIHELYYRD